MTRAWGDMWRGVRKEKAKAKMGNIMKDLTCRSKETGFYPTGSEEPLLEF